MFVEESSLYRRLTRVWHLLAGGAALAVAYNISSQNTNDGASIFKSCFYGNMAFLASWGINLGMTAWVTFVAGLVMMKNLDRHTFFGIQSKLFPIYFTVQGLTSFVGIVFLLTAKDHIMELSLRDALLLSSVFLGFMCGVLNGLWLGPAMTHVGSKKIDMEKEEGVIAPNIGSKLGENEKYRELSKKFGMYHGITALLNLLSLAGSMYILYYVSLELLQSSRMAENP